MFAKFWAVVGQLCKHLSIINFNVVIYINNSREAGKCSMRLMRLSLSQWKVAKAQQPEVWRAWLYYFPKIWRRRLSNFSVLSDTTAMIGQWSSHHSDWEIRKSDMATNLFLFVNLKEYWSQFLLDELMDLSMHLWYVVSQLGVGIANLVAIRTLVL